MRGPGSAYRMGAEEIRVQQQEIIEGVFVLNDIPDPVS